MTAQILVRTNAVAMFSCRTVSEPDSDGFLFFLCPQKVADTGQEFFFQTVCELSGVLQGRVSRGLIKSLFFSRNLTGY
jgi:hypothetical protein